MSGSGNPNSRPFVGMGMASSSSSRAALEDAYDQITLDDEESGGMEFRSKGAESANPPLILHDLVGKVLTNKPVNFKNLQLQTFVTLWSTIKGIWIKELQPNLFLFQFGHVMERDREFKLGPWSFENNLLVLAKVGLNENLENVPLNTTELWVHVYDLPYGCG
ncbi:hypothetical protein LguiB_032119 [Lonicera macranthoides]